MAEDSLPTLPRDIHFGDAGVRGIARGVALLARLTGAAYGPHGGRVMLERAFDTPLHATDAERICRDFALDDPLADIGVRLVREPVTHEEDPDLLGLVPGTAAEGEPGAARIIERLAWGRAGDGERRLRLCRL